MKGMDLNCKHRNDLEVILDYMEELKHETLRRNWWCCYMTRILMIGEKKMVELFGHGGESGTKSWV